MGESPRFSIGDIGFTEVTFFIGLTVYERKFAGSFLFEGLMAELLINSFEGPHPIIAAYYNNNYTLKKLIILN